jgi:DNA-binding response OmpR family regulator
MAEAAPVISMTVPQYRRREVTINGHCVTMAGKRHELLAALLVNRGQWLTYDQIIEIMWPDPDNQPLTALGCIDQALLRLRRVLGVDAIECRWGLGLRMPICDK